MSAYSLPDLAYDYDALEPHISAETLETHHGEIHQRYVDRLNDALGRNDQLQSLGRQPVDELLRNFGKIPEGARSAVRNYGGGHANHSLLWSSLSPEGGGEPEGALANSIEATFGSFEEFKKGFTRVATSYFGSGWAWLVHVQDQLVVYGLPNEDSPLTADEEPLLGLDVWEHAYYLDYPDRRAEYIDALWEIIDWGAVNERFEAVIG